MYSEEGIDGNFECLAAKLCLLTWKIRMAGSCMNMRDSTQNPVRSNSNYEDSLQSSELLAGLDRTASIRWVIWI